MSEFSHLNERDQVHMVDVGGKKNTFRAAAAQAMVKMEPDTLQKILAHEIGKGEVFACARVAGIMAAKRTAELIPLCHTIPIDGVEVSIEICSGHQVRITAQVHTTWHTGVEMEAMTAVSAAALTIYDMCKGIDREMEIHSLYLLEKSGGRSGAFHRRDQRSGNDA